MYSRLAIDVFICMCVWMCVDQYTITLHTACINTWQACYAEAGHEVTYITMYL
jgi:hypothetical protein